MRLCPGRIAIPSSLAEPGGASCCHGSPSAGSPLAGAVSAALPAQRARLGALPSEPLLCLAYAQRRLTGAPGAVTEEAHTKMVHGLQQLKGGLLRPDTTQVLLPVAVEVHGGSVQSGFCWAAVVSVWAELTADASLVRRLGHVPRGDDNLRRLQRAAATILEGWCRMRSRRRG